MNKTIAALILFIAATCVASIASAEWFDGLAPVQVEIDFENGHGAMIANHNYGDHTDYENKWLPLSIHDPASGVRGTFEIWISEWVGVCDAPCSVQVYFDVQNVNWITK